MIVTLNEAKKYLRVDHDDDDSIIRTFIRAAETLCEGTLRKPAEPLPINKVAVLFAVAYLYEHREEADHHAMNLTLRALLFGDREVGF